MTLHKQRLVTRRAMDASGIFSERCRTICLQLQTKLININCMVWSSDITLSMETLTFVTCIILVMMELAVQISYTAFCLFLHILLLPVHHFLFDVYISFSVFSGYPILMLCNDFAGNLKLSIHFTCLDQCSRHLYLLYY